MADFFPPLKIGSQFNDQSNRDKPKYHHRIDRMNATDIAVKKLVGVTEIIVSFGENFEKRQAYYISQKLLERFATDYVHNLSDSQSCSIIDVSIETFDIFTTWLQDCESHRKGLGDSPTLSSLTTWQLIETHSFATSKKISGLRVLTTRALCNYAEQYFCAEATRSPISTVSRRGTETVPPLGRFFSIAEIEFIYRNRSTLYLLRGPIAFAFLAKGLPRSSLCGYPAELFEDVRRLKMGNGNQPREYWMKALRNFQHTH